MNRSIRAGGGKEKNLESQNREDATKTYKITKRKNIKHEKETASE